MAYACRFCIAKRGLNPLEIPKLPTKWEAAAAHVEREHRYAVRRANETQAQAEHRVFLQYRKTLMRAQNILADRDPQQAAKAVETIERMGPIIEVHGVATAEDAINLIRNLRGSD